MSYTRDRYRNAARGAELPQARLTESDVIEIRRNRQGLTMRQQAQRYGVHYRTIERVRYWETWAHVRPY